MRDKNSTYWVGTERGLCSFDPLNQGFLGNGPSQDLTRGIPSASVWSFTEEPTNRYFYVGSDNSVSRYDNRTGKFTQYFRQLNFNKKSIVSRQRVLGEP